METTTAQKVEKRTICRCCAAGCGVVVTVADETVLEVRGDKSHELTKGYICPKGNGLGWLHHRPDRLNNAFLRGIKTSWEECANDLAKSIKSVITRYGVEAFGSFAGTGGNSLDFLSGGTLRRLLRKLQTPQIYSPLTIDMAPGYRAAEMVAGSAYELIPRWIPEDKESRLVIFVGCNPVVSHGYFTILTDAARRIRAFQQRGGRVWVIDPRNTETANRADGHVAPRPGTDSFILAWLLRELLAQPGDPELLAASTSPQDLQSLRTLLGPLTRRMAAERCNIDEQSLEDLLTAVRQAGRISIVTGTGVMFTHHALTTELLRWAVLAATGSLDRPGGMWFDTGWVTKLEERQQWTPAPVEGILGPGALSRPDIFTLTGERACSVLVDEIEAGNLKALIINGGSPLTSFPEPERMIAALKSLEVLAVIDVVNAPLTKLATHTLPATGQLERNDITFYNGRINVAPAVVKPVGDRHATWRVLARIAKELELDVLEGLDPDTATDDDLLTAFTATARYNYATLREAGPSGMANPVRSNWVNPALPDGRWRIAPPTLKSRLGELLAKSDDHGSSLILVCRRQGQHAGATQNVRTEKLRDRPSLLMSTGDAASRGIAEGDTVKVTSAAGSVHATVEITSDIRTGVVSLPHGWFGTNVAHLISGTHGLDPLTGMPQMTAIPVSVNRDNGPEELPAH